MYDVLGTVPGPRSVVTPQALAKRHSLTGPVQLASPAHGAASNQAKRGQTVGCVKGAAGLSQSVSFGAGDLSAMSTARGTADPNGAVMATPPCSTRLASSIGVGAGGGVSSSLFRAAAAASPNKDLLKVRRHSYEGQFIRHSSRDRSRCFPRSNEFPPLSKWGKSPPTLPATPTCLDHRIH